MSITKRSIAALTVAGVAGLVASAPAPTDAAVTLRKCSPTKHAKAIKVREMTCRKGRRMAEYRIRNNHCPSGWSESGEFSNGHLVEGCFKGTHQVFYRKRGT